MTFSPVCILFRRLLLGLFTQDERILMRAASIMLIDFFVEIGRSMNKHHLRLYARRGRRQVLDGGPSFRCMADLGWDELCVGHWGLIGIWIAFALDENIRGLILLCRWRSGRRKVGAQKRLHAVSG